jgi:hypothetical protein
MAYYNINHNGTIDIMGHPGIDHSEVIKCLFGTAFDHMLYWVLQSWYKVSTCMKR